VPAVRSPGTTTAGSAPPAISASNMESLTGETYTIGPRVSYRKLGRLVPVAQALAGGSHFSASSGGITGWGRRTCPVLAGGTRAVPPPVPLVSPPGSSTVSATGSVPFESRAACSRRPVPVLPSNRPNPRQPLRLPPPPTYSYRSPGVPPPSFSDAREQHLTKSAKATQAPPDGKGKTGGGKPSNAVKSRRSSVRSCP